MKRKVLGVILAVLLMIVPTVKGFAGNNVELDANTVMEYFNNQVGNSWGEGLCLNFVRTCFQKLGAPVSSSCCAYNYGSSHIQSSSSLDIPIGADVFFGNCGGGPCKTCGATYYGHIGVYVGNGEFVHATGGKVQKSKLSAWSSKYRGWGFHGNVTIVNKEIPISPQITSAKATSTTEATITWNKVAGATSYEVRRRKAGDGEGWTYYKKVGTTTSTTFKDTGLQAGSHYYYGIVAINSAGNSGTPKGDYRKELYTLTEKPKVTSVKAVSTSQLTVTWNKVTGATKYEIYRRMDGEGEGWSYYKKIGTSTGTSYTDSGLLSGTKYHYGIVAINGGGAGSGNPGAENRANAKTLTAVTGVSLNNTSLTLWQYNTGTLYATVAPSNASNKAVAWTSSNTSVATVDGSGKVTAIGAGSAVITVTTKEGAKTAKCNVTVKASKAVSLGNQRTVEDGLYRIKSVAGEYSLAIDHNLNTDGANIHLWLTTEDPYEQFYFKYVGDGFYLITSAGSGKAMEVAGGKDESSANVQQNTVSQSNAQLWQPVPTGTGSYWLVPKCAVKRCLDVTGGTYQKGTNMEIFTVTGEDNQKFELVPIGGKEETQESGRIIAGTISGAAGQTVAVPVRMDINPGIVAMTMKLGFDQTKLKLTKVEGGELLDASALLQDYTGNPYLISLGTGVEEENITATGTLITAYFEVQEGFREGSTPVTITLVDAYNKDLEDVKLSTVNGAVLAKSYMPGDVNRDGSVKLNDALLLRRYVAGWNVDIDLDAADVNRDGSVKLNDALLLRRYVAGWNVTLK